MFTRKGQAKIAAEDLVKKKLNKLTKVDKATFEEIRSKYSCERSDENYEEEKCMKEESPIKPQKKWWLKSSGVK